MDKRKKINKAQERLYDREIFTKPEGNHKPVKYRGYLIPEYFSCVAYFIDSNGYQVTQSNFETFKTWSAELLLRVTKAETVEIIRTAVLGARNYKGHNLSETFNPDHYQPVKASYLKLLSDNRPMLISYAITRAVQNHVPTRNANGTYAWTLWNGRDIPEAELQKIGKSTKNQAYVRLDYAFYQEVARLYKEAVLNKEKPIQILAQTLGKDPKTIQNYVFICRSRKYKLLAKTTPGKVSKVNNPTKRKAK